MFAGAGLSKPGVIAAYLLSADRAAVVALPRLELAESALTGTLRILRRHRRLPNAALDHAAMLLQHLVKNHRMGHGLGHVARWVSEPESAHS